MDKNKEKRKDWDVEYEKCRLSPWYFATNFMVIGVDNGKPIPFTTHLTEDEFNRRFHEREVRLPELDPVFKASQGDYIRQYPMTPDECYPGKNPKL